MKCFIIVQCACEVGLIVLFLLYNKLSCLHYNSSDYMIYIKKLKGLFACIVRLVFASQWLGFD